MLSRRHKVIDNLPGTRSFCPLVRWTPALAAVAAKKLDVRAREIVGHTSRDLVTRAAAFLLLSDSKSSFAIEGERQPRARAARWATAIGEAGARPVSIEELVRLQHLVIGDERFVKLGLRSEGGFVGTHERETRDLVPEHISAPPEALGDLLAGVIEYDLESYSAKLLPLIDWRPTADGNIDVLNDTAEYYRYFDATAHAEFLVECVEQAVEHICRMRCGS